MNAFPVKTAAILLTTLGLGVLAACGGRRSPAAAAPPEPAPASPEIALDLSRTPEGEPDTMPDRIEKTDAEWRAELAPETYRILRQKATERPGTGTYLHTDTDGTYRCAGCGLVLFESDAKYDSGCGWPAFHSPADAENVTEVPDTSHGMVRTEVLCRRCGGHLGHVFEDGPQPTGLRYCINSAALKLDPEKAPSEKSETPGE